MHGGDIYSNKVNIDFSINLNPLGMPPGLRSTLIDSLDCLNSYPEIEAKSLRRRLSTTLNVCEERLAITAGASEAFIAIARALELKEILQFTPCFMGYDFAFGARNVRLHYEDRRILPWRGRELFALREEEAYTIEDSSDIDNSFEIKASYTGKDSIYMKDYTNMEASANGDNLYYAIDEEFTIGKWENEHNIKLSAIVLANPNNPDGACMDSGFIKKLLDEALEREVYIIVDECFLPLTDRINESLIGMDNPYLIVVRSFTKSFAIPGIRLGYLYCSSSNITSKLQKALPEWNLSSLAIEAGKACLDDMEHLQLARDIIRKERCRLEYGLRSMNYLIFHSDSCFILFKSPQDMYERMLEKGILIRDCSDYRGLDKGYYRIAVKSEAENNELIDIMHSLSWD